MTTTTSLSISTTLSSPAISFGTAREGFSVLATAIAPLYRPTERAPIDLVTVCDISGSMSGEKIALVKRTLVSLISELREFDRLGLVVFSDTVSTVLAMTEMDVVGKQKARDRVEAITAGGSTNLCGGIIAGLDLLERSPNRNKVGAVLVLTDGLPNIGKTSEAAIVSAITRRGSAPAAAAAAATVAVAVGGSCEPMTCTLSTIGFGGDVDPKLLRKVAESGNGSYYFMQNEAEIMPTFATLLGGLLSVVAQSIIFRVEAASEGVVISQVRTRFKVREVRPGACYELAIPDIQSEERRDLLIAVNVPAIAAAAELWPLLGVAVTFKNVISGRDEQLSTVAMLQRPETVPPGADTRDRDVDKHSNRVAAAEAMDMAIELASQSKLVEAKAVLESAIARIRESITASDPFVLALVEDIQKCLTGLASSHSFAAFGHSYLATASATHSAQRHTSSRFTSSEFMMTSPRSTTLDRMSMNDP